MSDQPDSTATLELAERMLRFATLQLNLSLKRADIDMKRADAALKAEQTRLTPAQVVIASFLAGGVLVGATAALVTLLFR